MSISWTKDQRKVIELRNRNILVSAAAGSGKTAVLVERIITRITDPENPVDIDRLLIVTFTNAAAAEMRERIGDAVEAALTQRPQDEHLQRQLTLIHNAQITTIDSFCLYVIRNHFHEIDLEPNFRIGDEGELKLLREDVLAQVLGRNYEQMTPEYKAFVDGYAAGKSDAALPGMILQLYEFSRSYPWPKKWLCSAAKDYDASDAAALDKAMWMQPLVENIRRVTEDLVSLLTQALALTKDADGPYMYEKAVASDLAKYQSIAQCGTFSEFYEAYRGITYDRLAAARGFDGSAEKQERVKALRETAKDTVRKLKKQYFFCAPELMAQQLVKTAPMAQELICLTLEFDEAFAAEKRRKNLVDFHDLEHFALEILVDEETGQAKKTAEEFRDTFAEIMIDEYQDSNQVQESILRAVSSEERGQNNIFMVGDVKQSIYRFRLARPELFMEKYDTYSLEDSDTQRIDLHRNFRSRAQVLAFVNDIFYKIMRRSLGNVEYDEEAALYAGAQFQESDVGAFEPEVLLIDSDDELLEDASAEDKKRMEARMIAERIRRMMETEFVTDKKTGELRRVQYADIVILLRSLSSSAERFAAVLNNAGIPAHTVSSTGYFSAVEVQTVLAMLRILDNPRQDIPLTAVLRSPIAGLTDEELAALRLTDQSVRFHVCVLRECERIVEKEVPSGTLETKLCKFYKLYQKLRKLVPDTPIHELIEILLKETGYGDYAAAMPAGARRRANLFMLVEKAIAYETTSYKGLFHFLRYMDKLQKYDVDFGEADMVGENENVVRIMSIHKSKGLEFPVVFAAGLGRKFNRQDTRNRLVLHPDLGIGLDYMDGSRRTKTVSIAKKAIAKQIDLENLGEELRVLYVALTRAKEKLILTGTLKKAEETLSLMEQNEGGEISYLMRESAGGYLDWLLPAILSYGEKYPVRLVRAAELVTQELVQQADAGWNYALCMEKIRGADPGAVRALTERFSQHYAYDGDLSRKTKYSVSEFKQNTMRELMQQEQAEDTTELFEKEQEFVSYVPSFAREMEEGKEEVNIGALRGTAMHRVMECYRFDAEEKAAEQLAQMLETEQLTQEMYEFINPRQVEKFVYSDTGRRMKAAAQNGKLYRERAFVMGFTAEELAAFGISGESGAEQHTETEKEDLTLIQGIMDAFWMEEDGLVLLDYKTDRIDSAQELAARYEVQLQLYAEALERVYAKQGLRVKEKILYSFRLGKSISVK